MRHSHHHYIGLRVCWIRWLRVDFGSGYVVKRFGHKSSFVTGFLQTGFKVKGYVLIGLEMFGAVPFAKFMSRHQHSLLHTHQVSQAINSIENLFLISCTD
jgi:hypothetical protein